MRFTKRGKAVIWGVTLLIGSIGAVVGLGAWFVQATLASFGPPDNHVAASDSRVCAQTNGNNDPFADATDHFELVIPSSATHVVFSATVGGRGESDLDLRFTTTAAGLASFLKASHLEPPTPTSDVTYGGWPSLLPGQQPVSEQGPCGLTPPANTHMVYSQDAPGSSMGKNPRSLAVDMTDPAHPTVWIAANDL